MARRTAEPPTDGWPPGLAAIRSFATVDDRLWRGGAPDDAGYRALAAAGVTTIIDLRAERSGRVAHELLDELGLRWVGIPVRDGQAPTAAQAVALVDAVASSPGVTYVHCGAGVGRTGALVGAYRVAGGASWRSAMRANLAVGPPSLEQLAFVARLMPGEPPRSPHPALVWLSRGLDSPRRGWHVLDSRR